MAVIFKADWSVNIANLTVVAVAIMGMIGAWYDVKSQTTVNTKDIAALQAIQEKHKAEDVAADLRQDDKRGAVVAELKGSIRESTTEIKAEIRDLRNDRYREMTKK
jgi:hypothetical protein